jgi:hypothetical protein
MALYDAFGKEILPGDIILYPLKSMEGSPVIVRFQVAAIDEWDWTSEARAWQQQEYGRSDFPSFKLLVTEFKETPEFDPALERPGRIELTRPDRAIVVSGVNLEKRHALPKADQKGFWHKPGPGKSSKHKRGSTK